MRTACWVLVLVLLAGCRETPAGPDPNAHVGTYTLVAVNGSSLPYTALTVNERSTIILAGAVTFNADGTASDTYTYRYTDVNFMLDQTTEDFGTYTRDGDLLRVLWSAALENFVLEAPNTVTLTESGYVATYRK